MSSSMHDLRHVIRRAACREYRPTWLDAISFGGISSQLQIMKAFFLGTRNESVIKTIPEVNAERGGPSTRR